jgi:hypothetical protein
VVDPRWRSRLEHRPSASWRGRRPHRLAIRHRRASPSHQGPDLLNIERDTGVATLRRRVLSGS